MAAKPETMKCKELARRVRAAKRELYHIYNEYKKISVRKLIYEEDEFWGEPENIERIMTQIIEAEDELPNI